MLSNYIATKHASNSPIAFVTAKRCRSLLSAVMGVSLLSKSNGPAPYTVPDGTTIWAIYRVQKVALTSHD